MSDRLVAINFDRLNEGSVERATDSGGLNELLAARGLQVVLTRRGSFRTGEVLAWIKNGKPGLQGYKETTINLKDIVVVRNHVVSYSDHGYLAGRRVINADPVKQYTRGDRMAALLQRRAVPQATPPDEVQMPQGVVTTRPTDEPHLAAGWSEYRAYFVQNRNTLTIAHVAKTAAVTFVDVVPSDAAGRESWLLAENVTDMLGRDTGIRHMVGAIGLAQVGDNILLTGVYLGSPRLPTSVEAPDAARSIFVATADALADMGEGGA